LEKLKFLNVHIVFLAHFVLHSVAEMRSKTGTIEWHLLTADRIAVTLFPFHIVRNYFCLHIHQIKQHFLCYNIFVWWSISWKNDKMWLEHHV